MSTSAFTNSIISDVISNVTSEYTMSQSKIPMIMPPPPSVAQLAVLMLDGSGSMSDALDSTVSTQTKSQAVMKAMTDFIEVLKASKIKESFWLSVYGFSSETANMLSAYKRDYVRVNDIETQYIQDPSLIFSDRSHTDIGLALEKARTVAGAFRHDQQIGIEENYRRAVVILLSDGLNNVGESQKVLDKASIISNLWPLCTTAFGKDADSNLLKQIATDETHFLQTSDPKRLRDFFIHSSTIQRK